MDDARNHLLRLYHLEWLLRRGVWYPRWLPDLFLGYGYPVFNYYAPGFYYLALALRLALRLDLWDAFRAAGAVAATLAAGGTYALVTALWRRASLGILGAVLALYAPYSFQTNLYKRADLPEALGLALIPWLLLAIWHAWPAASTEPDASSEVHVPEGPVPDGRRSAGRATVWAAGAAAIGAAELLVHNLTALLAAGVAVAWVAYLLIARSGARAAGLARAVGAGALALGLTAFFWLPAATEGSAVQLEWLHDGDLRYENWLLDPGGDTPRQQSPYNRQTRSGLIDLHLIYPHQLVASPKVSLGQASAAALAALSLAGAGAVSLRRGRARRLEQRGARTAAESPVVGTAGIAGGLWRRPPAISGAATLPLWIVAAVCWAMTFTFAAPVWEGVPGLTLLQFPWRLLGPLGMSLAIAIPGSLAAPLRALERRGARWGPEGLGGRAAGWAIVAVMAAGIAVNGAGDRTLPHDDIDAAARTVDGSTVVLDERRDPKTVGTTSGREFLPRQVEVALYSRGAFRYRDVMERLYPEADWLGGRLYPLSGDLRFLSWRAEPLRLTARIANDGPETALLGVRQLDFPGWRAWLDGHPTPVEVAPRVPEQQAAPGFIVVRVPPGEHAVGVAFGPSPARLAGLALTLLTVLGATALVCSLSLSSVSQVGPIALSGPRHREGAPSEPGRLSSVFRVGPIAFSRRRHLGSATSGLRALWQNTRQPQRRPETRTALGLLALAALLPTAVAGYLAWRGVRPMLGSQSLLPLPDAAPVAGVWRAPDLSGSRNGLLVNIAEAVRRDLATVASPSGSARGPGRFVDVRQLTISDEEDPERGIAATSRRQWLYLHPPADVAVDVALPAGRHTWLQSALALDPAVWRVPTGDGVRFVAAVAPLNARGQPGTSVEVLDRTVNPRARTEQRDWIAVEADLSPWAGQTVRLTLRTLPLDDVSNDWAGWGNPVVAVRDQARSRPP